MNKQLLIRMKSWLCHLFGHRLKYSHTFGKGIFYSCKRCGTLIKDSEDLEY